MGYVKFKLALKEAGTENLASSCFWIVEQDTVVEVGSTTLIFINFTATQLCGGGFA